jgi:alpha-1,3-rhamnosyl/mannosyltransferase
MRHFLLDATPITPAGLTGAGRLVRQLVEHLFTLDRVNDYLIFGFAPEIWPASRLPPNFRYRRLKPWRWLGPLALEASRRAFVGGRTARYRTDLVHCTLEITPVCDEDTRVLFSLYDLARWSPHFLYATAQNLRGLLRTQLRYRLARRADAIHTISEYSAEQIAARLGIDRRRIRVIYPGVDPRFTTGEADAAVLARFGLSPRAYFLFVGQFGRQKNEEGLVKAFLLAEQEHGVPADCRLALVGDASPLHDGARHLRRSASVRLLGQVGDDDLLHLYRGAIGVVLPSFYEGFGLPLLEAMACGTPVIASNVTSLPEVVGDAGLIVSPGHTAELAEALSRLAGDAALGARLREAGLARAARFSYAVMAHQMHQLYDELTHGGA